MFKKKMQSMITILLGGVIFLSFLGLIVLFFNTRVMYKGVENLLLQNSRELKKRAVRLKKLQEELEEHPKKLKKGEMEHVMEEIGRVSKLWKSRRERLKAGLWKKIGGEGEREEKKEEVEGERDRLSKLKREKERVEELIKRTKVKYHKREMDENSFREIMKDYQKELMEISMKISELEPR